MKHWALEKEVSAVRAETRLGGGATGGGGDDLSDVLRAVAGDSLGAAPVALLRANGAISMEGGGGLLSQSSGIVERRRSRGAGDVRLPAVRELDLGAFAAVRTGDEQHGNA